MPKGSGYRTMRKEPTGQGAEVQGGESKKIPVAKSTLADASEPSVSKQSQQQPSPAAKGGGYRTMRKADTGPTPVQAKASASAMATKSNLTTKSAATSEAMPASYEEPKLIVDPRYVIPLSTRSQSPYVKLGKTTRGTASVSPKSPHKDVDPQKYPGPPPTGYRYNPDYRPHRSPSANPTNRPERPESEPPAKKNRHWLIWCLIGTVLVFLSGGVGVVIGMFLSSKLADATTTTTAAGLE